MIEISSSHTGGDIEKYLERMENNIPLKQISNLFKEDIHEGLDTPRSYDGSGLKPLSPKYLAWKRKKDYPSKIFDATHELINSVADKEVNKNWYQVFIKGRRAQIMVYLQRGGRRGFGISQTALGKARELMTKFLKVA